MQTECQGKDKHRNPSRKKKGKLFKRNAKYILKIGGGKEGKDDLLLSARMIRKNKGPRRNDENQGVAEEDSITNSAYQKTGQNRGVS